MNSFRTELEFEEALIKKLFQKGWSKDVLKYKTEEDLIENWSKILFNNNRGIDRLNDVPLTKTEMDQILEKIKYERTPYKLHSFINGRSVTIKRDNPLDKAHLGKEVSLGIYNREEIAGGKSIYQIAEQPIFKKKNQLARDRRGDFMLLINGMPVIHVELKKDDVPLSCATNQIEEYMHEGVFTGIFSLIQVFVAMKPNETVYFANPGPNGKFFKEYQFHWADFNNERIDDWEGIAEHLLSIPMAHMLIGYYTVADSADESLKVLRSYQYNAVSAISNKVASTDWENHDIKGGYIWHTTGSGKTLTSFKAAQLISNSNDADKVVFLVDRIDLGIQSLADYVNFADDDESVQGTENTMVLYHRLLSDALADRLIVTSIQKMFKLAFLCKENTIDLSKINSKRVVVVIDECHRDTFGEFMASIKEEFNKALYFGFTGTPIHDENSKKGCTTPDVFGDELHRYTIADGIRDGNVLGFDPEGISTFDPYELRKEVALQQAKASTEEEAMSDDDKKKIYRKFMNEVRMEDVVNSDGSITKGIEGYIPNSQYSDAEQRHKRKVVEDILRRFTAISSNHKFHGLFATTSIYEAIEYYRLFKEYLKDPKYPKLNVTAIFDPNFDFDDGIKHKEDGLIEIIEDYNKKFGKIYSASNAMWFKKDVCLRLAHKEQYAAIGNDISQVIDIVIVVDQLLTGFDSKWINVLYLDKMLRNEQIIQAFSRTNRLFDKQSKPHGIIKMYRRPNTMRQRMIEALNLYSGNKPFGVFVRKLEGNLEAANAKFIDIKNLFKSKGLVDFSSIDSFDIIEKAKFAKEFNSFAQLVNTCRIQGMAWNQEDYKFNDGHDYIIHRNYTENNFYALLRRYKELKRIGGEGGGETLPYDLDPAIISIPMELVDSQFMEKLFDKWYQKVINGENEEEALDDLHKSFATLSAEDQKIAKIIIDDIHNGKLRIEDDKSFRDYIDLYTFNEKDKQIKDLSEFTGIPKELLKDYFTNVNKSNPDEFGRLENLKKNADRVLLRTNLEAKYNEKFHPGKVMIKLDQMLRDFVRFDGYNLEEYK